jgi:multidrug efflux pump subunit AcrA (membrane-fusion protein)
LPDINKWKPAQIVKANKLFFWLPALLLIIPLALTYNSLNLTYSISSKGILYPATEWGLYRTADGNLINSLKDNSINSISHYSVTEFQRGDLGSFSILPGIFARGMVEKGDTIAFLTSFNERIRYVELQGELNMQKKLLSVYSSGEKPDEIRIASERINLASQEYETQKRITDRNNILFEKAFIPEEEYEISLNELHIKRQNFIIAQSEYEALTSGAKQEQLDYVKATIEALENQIAQIREFMSEFTITSPITGRITQKQGRELDAIHETIFRVTDSEKYIIVIPVDVYNLPYISLGQKVYFSTVTDKRVIESVITNIDNSVQMLNGMQKVYITALLEPGDAIQSIYPNMIVDVTIPSEKITVRDFLARLINEVYNN